MPNYEMYRMDIVVDVNDERAEVELQNLNKAIQRTEKGARNLGKADATPHVDKRARTELSNTEKVLGSAKKRADVLHRTRVNPTISMQDKLTSPLKKIESNLKRISNKPHKIVLEGVDKATGVVKRIISTLTSPLTLIGMGGGALGAGALIRDFFMTAGRTETLNIAMESVAKATGTSMKELLAAREAVMDLGIAEQEATLIMTRFMQGQLDIAQAANIARVAQDAAVIAGVNSSEAAETMVEAVAKLSPELLTAFGMTKNMNDIFSEHAKHIGIVVETTDKYGKTVRHMTRDLTEAEKKQAMLSYVLEEGAKIAGTYEGAMGSAFKKMGSLTRYWTDFKTKVGAPLFLAAFGAGIDALTDAFKRSIEWTKNNQHVLEQWGKSIESSVNGAVERVKNLWGRLANDEAFREMNWGDKLVYLLNIALDEVSAWLDSEGGMKLQETFTKLGEIGAKAWIAGLKGAFKGAVSSAAHGNLVGAGAMLGLASMLGGGLVLRGAWGLGKGLFGAGKWALGKLGLGSAGATAAGVAAETAATAGGVGAASRVLPILGRTRPWIGRIGLPIAVGLESINIARAEDKKAAAILGTGRIAGMIAGGKAGAVAGGAVGGLFGGVGAAPGAVIGGILGGIGGLFGGEAVAEKLNAWLDKVDFGVLKEKALSVWDGIKQKAGETWTWIKENFTLESIAEKAGNVVGYLESTIFSSEWWLEKWENVKAWAAETWAAMGGIWQSTKETINSTIFNTEWWGTQWGSVKSWTAGKWDEMKTVWETVKSDISSTLFSKTWWESKWENVKTWASGVLDDITARWESIKESFQTGREAGQAAAAHATGGILTRPHLGMVAEAGPEAIIPLSSKMRDRGIELWKQAGRFLGVAPHAEGGIFGSSKLVTEAGPEAGIPFSRSPERIRERGLGLWQQINNVFSPAMPALALAGSGAETGLLYDGIDYGPELSGQVQELNVPISIANITANISGSSLDVEDIAEQVGEQVKQQVKWEITRELANAIENRI
jgi:hypothetical protein